MKYNGVITTNKDIENLLQHLVFLEICDIFA